MSAPTKMPAGLARVLLVDDDPASRLAVQTVLRAGGYSVHSAASSAEAVRMMDEGEYELVLTDLRMECPEAGYRVLDHARVVEYSPATALLSTSHNASESFADSPPSGSVLISSEDVPELLTRVADLIGIRVTRRVARAMRNTGQAF